MAVSHFWKDFVGAGVFSYFMMTCLCHQPITLKKNQLTLTKLPHMGVGLILPQGPMQGPRPT